MVAILFNDAELFEQTDYTSSTEGLMWNLVKIGQAVSEKTFKDYKILYMYIAQGQGQITLGDKILIVTERVCYFEHKIVSFSHWFLIHYEKLNFQYFSNKNA